MIQASPRSTATGSRPHHTAAAAEAKTAFHVYNASRGLATGIDPDHAHRPAAVIQKAMSPSLRHKGRIESAQMIPAPFDLTYRLTFDDCDRFIIVVYMARQGRRGRKASVASTDTHSAMATRKQIFNSVPPASS